MHCQQGLCPRPESYAVPMPRKRDPGQHAAFTAELARLRGKKRAGTLTPAEQEALRRATDVRKRKIEAAEAAKAAEAARVARAVRNGRAHPELPSRKPAAPGRALPPRITRVIGGGSPGQGKRA
jgi:hypothetical protein